MSEKEDVSKFLWELVIKGSGIALENQAKTEDKNNVWWNIAEDIGKDMEENPEKYYEIGKWIYDKFLEEK